MNEKLLKALELLNEANCLIQEACPASDALYEISTAIENLGDEIAMLEEEV